MKRNLLFYCATIISYQLYCAEIALTKSWQDLFSEKQELIEKLNCKQVIEQFNAYKSGQAPAISDQRVKSIEIVENNEELVDIRNSNCSRIFMLPDPEKPFASDSCNSGYKCGSLLRKSVFERLLDLVKNLDLLAQHFGFEEKTICIGVFEGLRDISTQEILFNNKKKEIATLKPELTDSELDAETSKWVSPIKNNVPVHSTGAAVDIRLMIDGKFLDMGKFGVIWGHNPNVPTFSEDITKDQKNNRLFLLLAAHLSELTNYLYEYWHLSFGDRYAAYWKADKSKKIAQYGSIKL